MKIDFRERENLILRAGVIIFGMLYRRGEEEEEGRKLFHLFFKRSNVGMKEELRIHA